MFYLSFFSDVSPCQSSPCRGGTCNVESDGYSCDCLLFYSGRRCEGKYKKSQALYYSLNNTCVPGRQRGKSISIFSNPIFKNI